MIRAPGVNALLNSAAVLRQLVSRRNAFEEAVADRRSKARPDKQQRSVWTFEFKGCKIGKGFATFGQKLLSHLFTKKTWSFNISLQGDFWVTSFISVRRPPNNFLDLRELSSPLLWLLACRRSHKSLSKALVGNHRKEAKCRGSLKREEKFSF